MWESSAAAHEDAAREDAVREDAAHEDAVREDAVREDARRKKPCGTPMDITSEFIRSLLPARPEDGHKGTFGHVFVLAGSRGFTGAAKLAALGAARSGVGLVTVGVPKPLADVMAGSLLEAMSLPLPSTDAESFARTAVEPALEFAASKQAVVLGPGISQHADTRRFVLEFVRACPVPLLVDADGLNALAADLSVLTNAPAARILTPHPGEMARLTGLATSEIQRDRVGMALRFAQERACVLVLKGHGTVVADADGEASVNPSGNAGLATGGTGDVLSGLMGGLLAQGMKPAGAARLAVYLHGLAGDIAADEKTQRAMLARDVLEAIPHAWRCVEHGNSESYE